MKRTVFALIALYVLTILSFAGLYLLTPPREVVREIVREKTPEPVEKMVAPVEKMVQDTLRNWMPKESELAGETELLREIGPVRVQVISPAGSAAGLPVDLVQAAVGAVLTRKNVMVSEEATTLLRINLDGNWDGSGQNFSYHIRVALSEVALVSRPGGILRVPVETWSRDQTGVLSKEQVPQEVVKRSADLSEVFADAFHQAREQVVSLPGQP